MVNELIRREQKIIKFYADIYKHYAEPEENQEDFVFFLDEIAPTISFPVISTNENDVPNYPFEQFSINVDIDTSLNLKLKREYLQKIVWEMGRNYSPIIVDDSKGRILMKLYYSHSSLIDYLRYLPFISIIIIASFIFIGYIGFSSVKKNEESKVWVGMAKEAAHQLGTPLSSILAWLEIIRINKDNAEYIEETVKEMQSDISRLNMIATRFSKIGSMPEMKVEDLSQLIEITCVYFEKRLPHLGKRIDIVRELDLGIMANINIDLFQWVIENLLKNAAEAIEEKRGKVIVHLGYHSRKKIVITVRDTGKGMTIKTKRQIFHPGYTTKKRGWGLGLSLCKRIIEDYHKGKIYVKETTIGKGTTFVVEIPGSPLK